ncbi:NAD-dependent epimerase/dehydratase family protein [Flavobacterium gilvum]|uniref:3-beta hydroxysteroid dehydrogenase n=1 Tax=Flavobacterium gilvum TaxID=1492737 RepID=A0AAC9I3D4_9FLAO|nr:NAD-dependent epimerase/dehydratase family protein [Flavobacterium gilvum]AOW09559.1 3-beta hydroxysteroid dehydrogenase [Flavobacterium gilvum]KFC58975.1 UDP-glucose 4-epimerase [Flavobacterium gilvum]
MKILITGAAGYIASHTAEHLQSMGHEVVGLDNFSDYYDVSLKQLNANALTEKGIGIEKIDLRFAEQLQTLPIDFEYIFHFAAQPGISVTSSFEDYLGNNVIGTKNLLDFALKNKNLALFVNIATSSIYGIHATFDESETPKPASFYGVTKLAAEQLVLASSRLGHLKACSLRLYSVYGPRERPEKLYTKLIANAFNNIPFPLYKGSESHLRSFTYVQDIVDGVVSVIGKEDLVNNEIINLGTEEENTTQQGIEIVEQILNKKIELQIVEARTGDQLRTKAVIDKARKLLGYDPKTSLYEGLKAQVKWYQDNFCK